VTVFTSQCTDCKLQQSSASASFYDAAADFAANGLTKDTNYPSVKLTYGSITLSGYMAKT
jgi:hypothetical protein